MILATLGIVLELFRRLLSLVLATLPAEPVAFDIADAWDQASQIVENASAELAPLTVALTILWAIGVIDAWLGSRRYSQPIGSRRGRTLGNRTHR